MAMNMIYMQASLSVLGAVDLRVAFVSPLDDIIMCQLPRRILSRGRFVIITWREPCWIFIPSFLRGRIGYTSNI